jgi:hypothetical protein
MYNSWPDQRDQMSETPATSGVARAAPRTPLRRFRNHAVKQVKAHRLRCGFQQPQNHPGDDQIHDRIEQLPADQRSDSRHDHGQTRQAVRPGVIAIGYQRWVSYATTHTDANYGDQLIAGETNEPTIIDARTPSRVTVAPDQVHHSLRRPQITQHFRRPECPPAHH